MRNAHTVQCRACAHIYVQEIVWLDSLQKEGLFILNKTIEEDYRSIITIESATHSHLSTQQHFVARRSADHILAFCHVLGTCLLFFQNCFELQNTDKCVCVGGGALRSHKWVSIYLCSFYEFNFKFCAFICIFVKKRNSG